MNNILDHISEKMSNFDFLDFLDIVFLALLFFGIYMFTRKRRAFPVLLGAFIYMLVVYISDIAGLESLHKVLGAFVLPGSIVIVIIFQEDIRAYLEKSGNAFLNFFKNIRKKIFPKRNCKEVEEIAIAVTRLSATHTGSLIVLERNTGVDGSCDKGTVLDAVISTELLLNIFHVPAPLHDGAVVIRKKRIYSAGCFLPSYSNPTLSPELGSRHRAALGMSRNSDAIVIVVSEEDGKISYAENGSLYRAIDQAKLKSILEDYFGVSKKHE